MSHVCCGICKQDKLREISYLQWESVSKLRDKYPNKDFNEYF